MAEIERLLEGRRAIVTGASRGIGAETARALARAGASLVLAARDTEALARVAGEIADQGGRAVTVPTDVADAADVERMVDTAVERLGGLTKVAALDYAAQGIRVNAIAPGPILTDRLQAAGEQAQHAAGTAMPMRRIGLPAEVATAAVWLCSDQAAFITGETLAIDGGKLAGTPPFSGPT
jgi:NAD(P)-dependent dehydrogenase (short-subunit alcohol dehydrogenase family)